MREEIRFIVLRHGGLFPSGRLPPRGTKRALKAARLNLTCSTGVLRDIYIRWGTAFNIPRDCSAFHHIIQQLIVIRYARGKEGVSRLAPEFEETPPAAESLGSKSAPLTRPCDAIRQHPSVTGSFFGTKWSMFAGPLGETALPFHPPVAPRLGEAIQVEWQVVLYCVSPVMPTHKILVRLEDICIDSYDVNTAHAINQIDTNRLSLLISESFHIHDPVISLYHPNDAEFHGMEVDTDCTLRALVKHSINKGVNPVHFVILPEHWRQDSVNRELDPRIVS
jgi:hypothetical protein